MKRILKRVAGCLVIVLGVLMLSEYAGRVLNPEYTDGAMDTIRAFHELPPDSVEVIVYGSSIAWSGLDPLEMYQKYGIGAYNYGCNWQHLNTTLLFLQDSLRTQSPKVALVETFKVGEILEDSDLNGEIYYSKAISDFKGKRDYLRQCFGSDAGRYLSYYMPLSVFHENWSGVGRENFLPDGAEDCLGRMGYAGGSDDAVQVTIGDYRTFPQKELSRESIEVLDAMVRLCRENDVQLIFYTAPHEGECDNIDAMRAYAEENGCTYLNLFEKAEETGIDGSTDFSDWAHLNGSGARKTADYLGAYIAEHCDVTDMRNMPGNLWEKSLFQ